MTTVLITQCLQRDFVDPIGPHDPLPNLLHVGYTEATRLLGPEPAAQLFAAVAQVLAWVFQVRRHPSLTVRAPEVSVPDELDPLKNPSAGRRRLGAA